MQNTKSFKKERGIPENAEPQALTRENFSSYEGEKDGILIICVPGASFGEKPWRTEFGRKPTPSAHARPGLASATGAGVLMQMSGSCRGVAENTGPSGSCWRTGLGRRPAASTLDGLDRSQERCLLCCLPRKSFRCAASPFTRNRGMAGRPRTLQDWYSSKVQGRWSGPLVTFSRDSPHLSPPRMGTTSMEAIPT